MVTCDRCKLILDDGTVNCPQCGDKLEKQSAATSVNADAAVPSLLASAGISKAKGAYQQATEQCMQVLKLQPKNHEVYSLLGDIYEAQEKYREASQWYSMALEIAPDNEVDSVKLDRLQKRISELEEKGWARSDNGKYGWFDRLLLGRGLSPTVKITTIVSTGLVLLLIIAGLVAMIWRQPDQESTVVDAREPMMSMDQQADIPPNAPGALNEPGVSKSPAPQAETAKTAAEEQLLKSVTSSPLLAGLNIAVEDVKIDPRVNLLVVSFREKGAFTRVAISADAAAIAGASFAASPGMNWIMVRCYGSVGSEASAATSELLMVADIERNSVAALGTNSTAEQVQNILVKPWWHQKVQ